MKPETLQIKHAGSADIPMLLDLYQHLDPGDERPALEAADEILGRFLAQDGNAIFVGELDGALVSSCTLVIVPNLTRGGRPYGLIENVVTHADYRRRGLGRRLLSEASDAAWSQGCYKVMLLTGTVRPETLAFYLGAGFEQSKTGFQKRRV